MRALGSTIARYSVANDATAEHREAIGRTQAKCSPMSRRIMQARSTQTAGAAKGPTPSALTSWRSRKGPATCYRVRLRQVPPRMPRPPFIDCECSPPGSEMPHRALPAYFGECSSDYWPEARMR
jgi:hypothetical protein